MARKAIAAAWHEDGTLYVLVKDEGKSRVLSLRRGRCADVGPGVSGATGTARIALAPGGLVVTMTSGGRVLMTAADGALQRSNLDASVHDLVTANGVVYALTAMRGLIQLDASKRAWSVVTPFERALGAWAKKRGLEVGGVHSIVSGKRGPIVAVRLDNYRHNVLFEFDGRRWAPRAEIEHRVNAIARDPKMDVVYTVGDALYAVSARGRVKALPEGDDERDDWSACWARGRLVVGSLDSVDAVDVGSGAAVTLLPPSRRKEVRHNHSLASHGDRVAFVRADELFVLGDTKFARQKLD